MYIHTYIHTYVLQALAQSLEAVRNETTVLTYSWDVAVDNCTDEHLGTMLYDTLFELAPNLKTVFRKPRQVCVYVYMYVCMYVYVCVCAYAEFQLRASQHHVI